MSATGAGWGFDPQQLDAYLRQTVNGLEDEMSLEPIAGGQSNPTFFVTYPNRRMAMADTLARLHRVDWNAVGLADYGRPGNFFTRQVGRWIKQWELSKTREIPDVERVAKWLSANRVSRNSVSTRRLA